MRTRRARWLVAFVALVAAGATAAWVEGPAAWWVFLSCIAVIAVSLGWWATPAGSGRVLDVMARAFAYAGTPYAPASPYLDLHLFTDEQLCRAWRASHPALREHASVEDTLLAVEERQTYLDELARRHPDAVIAWLASQPDAADDPLRHLADTHGHRLGIDWDELIPGLD